MSNNYCIISICFFLFIFFLSIYNCSATDPSSFSTILDRQYYRLTFLFLHNAKIQLFVLCQPFFTNITRFDHFTRMNPIQRIMFFTLVFHIPIQ